MKKIPDKRGGLFEGETIKICYIIIVHLKSVLIKRCDLWCEGPYKRGTTITAFRQCISWVISVQCFDVSAIILGE